nr:hypothetical protein [uncultured Noviherbaspirillum sp.]
MDSGSKAIRGPGDLERPQRREPEPPLPDLVRPQGGPAPALTLAGSEAFSMDRVGRFFSGAVVPQGNALVGEIVDENGPLAGRESARGKRRSGALPMQFSDDGRTVLFVPNDAPDELPQGQAELDRLLRHQESRERRSFTA